MRLLSFYVGSNNGKPQMQRCVKGSNGWTIFVPDRDYEQPEVGEIWLCCDGQLIVGEPDSLKKIMTVYLTEKIPSSLDLEFYQRVDKKTGRLQWQAQWMSGPKTRTIILFVVTGDSKILPLKDGERWNCAISHVIAPGIACVKLVEPLISARAKRRRAKKVEQQATVAA